MQLLIHRVYYPDGTNGTLFIDDDDVPLCHTIELPWKDNHRRISCIPEGTYRLRKRYSKKFNWHLHVQDVPGRSLILFHPANNALLELEGCIAPVTRLSGAGRGDLSVAAFRALMARVNLTLSNHKPLFLTISSGLGAGAV